MFVVFFPEIVMGCSCDWVYDSMENENNMNSGKSYLTEDQFLKKRVEGDLKDSKYVFRGFVYQGNVHGKIPDIDLVEYKVRVQELYKGKAKSDIKVSSERATSCAGPTLKVGNEYIFFLSGYYLSQCALLVEDYYQLQKVDKFLKELTAIDEGNNSHEKQ